MNDVLKFGYYLWFSGIVIGLLSLLLAPFTGISLFCCFPSGFILLLGSCIVLLERHAKKVSA